MKTTYTFTPHSLPKIHTIHRSLVLFNTVPPPHHFLLYTDIFIFAAEFFPGFKTESAIFYFTRDCDQLNETEKQVVYTNFKKVLDDQGVCKSRASQVCDIKVRKPKRN